MEIEQEQISISYRLPLRFLRKLTVTFSHYTLMIYCNYKPQESHSITSLENIVRLSLSGFLFCFVFSCKLLALSVKYFCNWKKE